MASVRTRASVAEFPPCVQALGLFLLLLAFLVVPGATQVPANSPPQLRDFARIIILDENTPVGNVIGNLTAYDADQPANGLTFTTDAVDTAALVNLSAPQNVDGQGSLWRVNIILKTQLDRDFAPNERKLYFKITDTDGGPNSEVFIPAMITLYIRDVNDVAPQLQNLPYSATINESVTNGSVVFSGVTKYDPDNGVGGTVQFSMETDAQAADEEYRTTFVIDKYNGIISLARPLDYEKHNFYQFKIKATDGGGLSSLPANFVVTVLDVQDSPPYFVNLPYSAEVPENIALGSSVQQVSGLDGDRGIPNNLTYRFLRGDHENFAIDSATGWITVRSALDRDDPSVRNRGGVYAMYVQAAEVVPTGQVNNGATTASTLVTITVTDVNDNAPTFAQSHYNASILENMQAGVPVTLTSGDMRVTDLDQGTNSHFMLSVEQDGQPFYDFAPLPQEGYSESTVLLKVNNSADLDYEKRQTIVFQVVAREVDTAERRSSTATVTVRLEDMNDNSPVFEREAYTVNVPENTANGTPVLTVTATDRDSGSFGQITYSLRGGNNKFRIEADTGEILVSGTLDREEAEEVYLTVEARDGGGQRTPVEVRVTLTDVNDNPPVFRRADYEGVVRETDAAFLRPLLVEATDQDQEGTDNSRVRYELVEATAGLLPNFSIDAGSGSLGLNAPLDYEGLPPGVEGQVTLKVVAHDMGTPRLSSTVLVNVTLEDLNDNAPIFAQTNYTVSIPENATTDTTVATVVATDADGTSPNNQFIYRIESGALDKFRIDFETGRVSVAPGVRLDREDLAAYVMNVSAIDKGTPPLTGRCVVIVDVTDVNDEMPVFVPSSVALTVSESAGVGSSLVTLTARDVDLDSRLRYSMLANSTRAYDERNEEIDARALNVTAYFDVHEENGTVYVASALDRETAQRVVVRVMVEDVRAWQPRPQTATATVTITLEDYNDNAPKFQPSSTYRVHISEGQDLNSEALRVAATDPDRNQQLTYSLVDNSASFTIDPNSGIIKLQRRLDRERDPSLTFLVVAKDNGSPAQSSTATVSVTVQDINDNAPIFDPHDVTYHVAENASIRFQVARLRAVDPDSDAYGTVRYSLEGPDQDGTFDIHDDSGVVEVARPLDRETRAEYSLTVVARDNPDDPKDQRSNRTVVRILIDDVNDNSPQFQGLGTSLPSVPESAPLGTTVLRLTASDPDFGDNGRVVFSLTDTNATNARGQPLFQMDAQSGSVTTRGDLHNAVGIHFLTVNASDRGSPPRSNVTVLYVDVLDVNDDPPRFVVPSPNNPIVVIEEGQPRGKTIVVLSAVDDDSGRNGEVVYSLVENKDRLDWQKFHVDPASGNLTNTEILDREAQESYEIQVRATDRGFPRNLSSDLTLTVRVQDIDDQPPQFNRQLLPTPYSLAVVEEDPQACVGSVAVAEDNDVSVNNTITFYYIYGEEDPGLFELDPNGTLCLRRKLDREARPYVYLLVLASPVFRELTPRPFTLDEQGRPSLYNASNLALLWVNVTVADINDNRPRFNRRDLALGVTRNTQYGSFIMNLKDEAVDLDSKRYGIHSFERQGPVAVEPQTLRDQLEGTDPNTTFLVFANGSVKTNMFFKPTMYGFFLLRLVVKDTDGWNDTATLRISLINDDQRLKVVFRRSVESVGGVKDQFIQRLKNVTGYRIVVDQIQTHQTDDGKPVVEQTDMFIHGENPETNEVVPAEELLNAIDTRAAQMVGILNDYNVLRIVPTSSQPPEDNTEQQLRMWLILVAVVLGALVVLLTIAFFTSRRKYQRKLKAATAMAYGSQDSDLYKHEVPGTNIHSYEKPRLYESQTRF